MAAGGKLSNLTECSLCLHAYERPRSLPCLHGFCQACLQEHLDKNGKPDGTVDCPNCRKVATIPLGGVGEFPLNFHLNQLKVAVNVSRGEQTFPQIMVDFSLFVH